MSYRDLIVSARNLLENFVEATKPFKRFVRVKFFGKRKDYGLKLYIVICSATTNSTIINTFMKLRSRGQLRILRCTLKGIQASISHYINDICPQDSDTEIVTIE